jgi:hypothetical protein
MIISSLKINFKRFAGKYKSLKKNIIFEIFKCNFRGIH